MGDILQLYKDYIRDGGYAISRLLFNRQFRLKQDEEKIGLKSLLILQQTEQLNSKDASFEMKMENQTTVKYQDIYRLYRAVDYLIEILAYGKNYKKKVVLKSHKDWPRLIRNTYGEMAPLTEYFSNKNVRPRQNAVSRLLKMIDENSNKQFVEYDFYSDEAKNTLDRIFTGMEEGRQTAHIKQAVTAARLVISNQIDDFTSVGSELLMAVKEYMNIDNKGEFDTYNLLQEPLDTTESIITLKNKQYHKVTAPETIHASIYELYGNDILLKAKEKPEFIVDVSGYNKNSQNKKNVKFEIRAKRSLNDVDNLIKTAEALGISTQLTSFTQPHTNTITSLYSGYANAVSSLRTISQICPRVYKRMTQYLNNTQSYSSDVFWVFACLIKGI